MKKELDPTLSSRPIDVPEEIDLKAIEDSIALAQKNLNTAVDQTEARKDERYVALITANRDRLVEIAMNTMQLQPTDYINLAKARGQFAERIILANEILSWQNVKVKEGNALKRLATRLTEWRKKIENQVKGKSNAD